MFKPLTRFSATAALALTLASSWCWAQQTWMVNFKDSDIQEVIKFVADITGRTVVIDPRVKGRVKVISNEPLTEAELLALFRTVLEVHDFSLVEVGDLLRIVPLKDARSSPVPVTGRTTDKKGYLTQVIQLQNIAAAKVLPSIRPLVPQHSHLSAYDPSNAIIITDSAENIARIRELIEQLDKSATPVTEIIELKYANATDLAQVFDKLNPQSDQNRSPDKTLNIIPDKRNNALLVTGEDMQRERIRSLVARLDRPRSQSGNVRVVYLQFAQAKTAAETLTKVMANLSKLAPGGAQDNANAATVEADEDTNSLLITASGDDLDTLLEVVERLDIRRAQVLIEAIIVEMEETEGRNLGVQWMFRNNEHGAFGSSVNGAPSLGTIGGAALQSAVASDNDPQSVAALEALGGLASALGSTVGEVLGVIGTNDDNDFMVLLAALESDTKTNILSTPSLLTTDNNEASFSVGQNIPLLTGSTTTGTNGGFGSPFQTIQREDVGIKLTVKPQVNEGNTVLLDIMQEISSVSPDGVSGAQDLVTNQRKIETQVLAADGEVIVLGGLIQDDSKLTERRVPLLGKIPVLGRLFRSNTRSNRKTNLMIFLKASVLRDDLKLTGATAEKYQYVRDRQIQQRDNGFGRLSTKNLNLLPELSYYDLMVPEAEQETRNLLTTPAAEQSLESQIEEATSGDEDGDE